MIQKNILILSPINEYGGINLDVGFISNILEKKNDVKVISLGNYFKDSQVFYFNKNLNYNSLNRILYNSNLIFKLITSMVCFLKPINLPNHFRISDIFTKLPFININRIKLKYLESEIKKVDIVFICSQLTASFNKEIIEIAKRYNKLIIFKTTGHIISEKVNNEYADLLTHIHIFIHHSKNNNDRLKKIVRASKHLIIDQNTYLENELLEIVPKQKKVTHFFTLSRLHTIKQIDIVINAFLKTNNSNLYLNIYGDGEAMESLKELAFNNPNIKFLGKVDYADITAIFKNNDCLIISSKMEAGPYTAIESMAAATPIISTRVGSMEERLQSDYPFFYDGSINELVDRFKKLINLEVNELLKVSNQLRKIYKAKYTNNIIKNKYEMAFKDIN